MGLANNAILFISILLSFTLDVTPHRPAQYLLSDYPTTHDRLAFVIRHQWSSADTSIFYWIHWSGVIGGNFRGVLLLATVINTITGIGLFFLGVPYPILLSVFAFILEFVPVVGFYVTAIVRCVFFHSHKDGRSRYSPWAS